MAHNTDHDWAVAVADGVKKIEIPLTIASPGVHTLHVWAVDPGIVLERLVLAHGDLKPSYLGPPESPRVSPTVTSTASH